MYKNRKYDLNPETLRFETTVLPRRKRLLRYGTMFLVSSAMAVLYFWLYSSVLGLESPKLAYLRKQNQRWQTEIALLNRNLDKCDAALTALEMRNDDVYRNIFGMDKIPQEVLESGIGGVNRYSYIDELDNGSALKSTSMRLDRLTRKACVESKSFDEVATLSKRAGDMASCIPAIPPIDPTPGTYRISSVFGTRIDPVYGGYRHHAGVDFSTKKGNPIYATGDGVIQKVSFQFFGYGNMVVIDHGFGYKTRYAHMQAINVAEGMKIKRGECIGTVGNSGKSTGPHLHYEVLYRDRNVNPYNFYDLTVTPEEYSHMVTKVDSESQAVLRPNFRAVR